MDLFTKHCATWAAIREAQPPSRATALQHDLEERVARHLTLCQEGNVPCDLAMAEVTLALAAATFRACLLSQPSEVDAQLRFLDLLSDMADCLPGMSLHAVPQGPPAKDQPDDRR